MEILEPTKTTNLENGFDWRMDELLLFTGSLPQLPRQELRLELELLIGWFMSPANRS